MEQLSKEVKDWIGQQRGYVRFWLNWHLSQKNQVSKRVRIEIVDVEKKAIKYMNMDPLVVIAEQAKDKFDVITSVYIYDDHINVNCWSEKMDEMTEVLRWFANKGIRQTKDSEEDSSEKSRTWYFEGVFLTAYFESQEKGACKYIEDGTEEVPKYKMVCPGDPDYPKDE